MLHCPYLQTVQTVNDYDDDNDEKKEQFYSQTCRSNEVYYVVILIGRITGLARPSVRPSVRPSTNSWDVGIASTSGEYHAVKSSSMYHSHLRLFTVTVNDLTSV